MIASSPLIVALTTFGLCQLVLTSDVFTFCADNKCGNCPVQVTDAGTGYPNCVIYSTDDVFGGQPEFNGSAGG
jgi:hypothetical protein